MSECHMAVGRKQRRIERQGRVKQYFPESEVDPVLDLLEVLEVAWHDCYGDISPSEEIVDDVLLLSRGNLVGLIRSVLLAITDWRDLKMAAADLRGHT